MGKNFEWITHNGERLLYVNYSGLSEEEYIATIGQLEKVITAEPLGSVKCVAIVQTGKITEGIRKATKEHRKKTKDHIKAVAAVGLKGPIKILVRLIYRDVFYADTVEEAKDWAAKQ